MNAGISKQQLVRDIKGIGVNEGDHLAISLSFKSVGYVKGGPNALINALIEVVGPHGTIMMPTHTSFFHSSKVASNKINYIFDYRKTKAETGIVPETLRNKNGSIRSHHPTFSNTAVGKFAEYLTVTHDEKSRYSLPFSRLAKIDGKLLSIGIEKIIASHEAHYRAGLLSAVPNRYSVKFQDDCGKVKIFEFNTSLSCVEKEPELIPILKKIGIVQEGRIGNAKANLIPIKKLLEVIPPLLRNNPSLYLCENIFCFWCRELERRNDLYNKIMNPRYFQRVTLMIMILTLINWFRLKNYVIDEIIEKVLIKIPKQLTFRITKLLR